MNALSPAYLLSILRLGWAVVNSAHHHLSRTQPQRPLAARVLDQDGHHTFDRAQYSTVDHHGAVKLAVSPFVPQIEALRKLKVQLNGGALVFPVQCIGDGDVHFGAVEGTVCKYECKIAT